MLRFTNRLPNAIKAIDEVILDEINEFRNTVADQKLTHFGFHKINKNLSVFERIFSKNIVSSQDFKNKKTLTHPRLLIFMAK